MSKHLITVDHVGSRECLERFFSKAEYYSMTPRDSYREELRGKDIATLFYEPSTRTRFTFEFAAHRLGASVVSTENAREFSSVAKGETLEDTIRVVSSICDAIVLRHDKAGAALKASQVSSVPIINAGDGTGEHPSQALLDLYTIKKELGRIDRLSIAMIGDLKNGRTVHSLARILNNFDDINLIFVSPTSLAMPQAIKDEIRHPWTEKDKLEDCYGRVDVLYVTRMQKERFSDSADYERYNGEYVISNEIMRYFPSTTRILHPLPRVNEISPSVDSDPRAAYFRQAENGLYMRMAILSMVLSTGCEPF
jgi:aspartate carbamoyltransferase catalytic subunit